MIGILFQIWLVVLSGALYYATKAPFPLFVVGFTSGMAVSLIIVEVLND